MLNIIFLIFKRKMYYLVYKFLNLFIIEYRVTFLLMKIFLNLLENSNKSFDVLPGSINLFKNLKINNKNKN